MMKNFFGGCAQDTKAPEIEIAPQRDDPPSSFNCGPNAYRQRYNVGEIEIKRPAGDFLGDGGALHAMLLAYDVHHRCQKVEAQDWTEEKQSEAAQSCPPGRLPIAWVTPIDCPAAYLLDEPRAAARYISTFSGRNSKNTVEVCFNDTILEKAANWRNSFNLALKGGKEVDSYKEGRKSLYQNSEDALRCVLQPGNRSPFINQRHPCYGEIFLWAVILDDCRLVDESLRDSGEYPLLKMLHEMMMLHPRVHEMVLIEEGSVPSHAEQKARLDEEIASHKAEQESVKNGPGEELSTAGEDGASAAPEQ